MEYNKNSGQINCPDSDRPGKQTIGKPPSPRRQEFSRPGVTGPEVTRPAARPEISKPEDGVIELDGGVMLTTSEILDFSEGEDSF